MKRIVRLILIVLAALMLMGCRSSRKVVKEDAHIEEELCDSAREDSVTKDSQSESREASFSERERASVRVTELSEPDSMGRQHPVRVTEIDYSRESDANIKEKEEKEAQTVKSRQSLKKGKKQGNRSRETKTARRRPVLWWLYAVIALLGVALYYYYKKRRR